MNRPPFFPSLRMQFALLCAALLLAGWRADAQEPFARDIPAVLDFTENYNEVVRQPSNDPSYFDEYYDNVISVTGEVSMAGVDLSTINAATVFELELGYLLIEFALDDDAKYRKGDTSATFPLIGMDPDTANDVKMGKVTLRWTAARLTFEVTIDGSADDFEIVASDYAGEAGSLSNEFPATLAFAGRRMQDRTVYFAGTVELYNKTVGKGDDRETYEDLSRVRVSGGIDSTPPQVVITNPSATMTATELPAITVSGSATDARGVDEVWLRVNNRAPVAAVLNGSGGWSVADVALDAGGNTLVATAVDVWGNERRSEIRNIRRVVMTTLTVNAAGSGAGRVTSNLFPPLDYQPGAASPERSTVQEASSLLVVTAAPAQGDLFDGWTSNYPLTPQQAGSLRLEFLLQEGQTLTANFAANPFTLNGAAGRYDGLIDGPQPELRGLFVVKLTTAGNFTAKVQLGSERLAVKGRFNSRGGMAQPVFVRKGGRLYQLQLELDLTPGGMRTVSGTLLTPGGDATLAGELSVARVGKAAVPQRGVYQAAIAPAEGNDDANYPAGSGSGLVRVSKKGSVRFVGRLADGSKAVSLGARLSQGDGWPFHAQLYGGRGSLSGRVEISGGAPAPQMLGALMWHRPEGVRVKGKVSPGFSGESILTGSRVKPHSGF